MLWLIRTRGVGTRIGLGYVAIALILVAAIGITLWQVQRSAAVTTRLVDLRAPTAQASLEVLNGVNHSVAALRGWMILGQDKFKAERRSAWESGIDPAVHQLEKLSIHWTDPKDRERLQTITASLAEFRRCQQEIEDIAQATDNTPATRLLVEEAAPQADALAANITRMIDLEADQPATAERKALLGMMADVRGTFGLGLGAVRAYLLTGDAKFKQQFETLWTKNTQRFEELRMAADLLSPEQGAAFEPLCRARANFAPLPAKMFEIRGGAEWNRANALLASAFEIKELLTAMLGNQKGRSATDMAEAKRISALLIRMQWGLLLAGTLLAAVLGTLITRSIKKPIQRIVAALDDGAAQVSEAANQVSTAAQHLAEGASEQASSLEETSSALEEMAARTRANAESARQADELASQTRESAVAGDQCMSQLNTAMGQISESSGKVSRIIKVIEEIAFQTNLLALNAAVEAARAGEHGKGFAVVAEEVRNLAQRSAAAAKDTTGLIADAVQRAQQGTRVAAEAGGSLTQIVGRVEKVSELIQTIARAGQEQSLGVEQINAAVAQMDRVTQQNAAGAEESASAAEQLSAQAQTVKGMVADLAALIDGARRR